MTRRFLRLNITCLTIGSFFAVVTWKYWRRNAPVQPTAEVANIPVLPPSRLNNEQRTTNSEKFRSNNQQLTINNPSPALTATASVTPAALTAPSKVNLAVPFTPQAPERNWNQPWQDACEEAAALMLDAFYKGYGVSPLFAKDEMLKMVKWQETEKVWGRSITIEQVKELFEWYAFGAENTKTQKTQKHMRIVENPTVEDIKKFIANRQPVLAVAYGTALPNPYFRSGGPEYHALIIRGYTEDKFITNDPGTWRGENFTYKYDDLMNAIHDWNNGDVKHGPRRVLVVE